MATGSIFISPIADISIPTSGTPCYAVTPAGAFYSAIDEYPTADSNDYMQTNGVSSYSYSNLIARFRFASVIARSSSIVKVVLHVYGYSPYFVTMIKLAVGTSLGTSQIHLSNVLNPATIEETVNPVTGVAWTWADVASLDAGFALSNSTTSNDYAHICQIYLEIVYNLCSQVTVDAIGLIRDSDMLHAIESATCHLNSVADSPGVLQSLRWEIAADSGGSTLLADSGTVAITAADGQVLTRIQTWTPSSSATYYLRVGIVCEDHSTVYWVYVGIVITLPTITASSVAQNGEYLVASMTISDPTCATGMLFYAGGDSAPMELDGNTVTGTLWVERGDITWTMVVVTPWITLSIQGTVLATYVPLPGIHLYQDDAELDATNPSLVENVCPDVPTCSFTVLSEDIDVMKPIVVKMRGKRWHMDIQSADDNDDGTTTIRAVDAGKIDLDRQITLTQTPTDSWSIAQLLKLQWRQNYTALFPHIIVDAQWKDTAVKDILSQLAHLNAATCVMHDKSVSVLAQDGEPVYNISKGRQRDFSQRINHVYEEYTIADYPSPASLWSLTPSLWTGTVAAVTYTPTTRLKPPSGAMAWLKATGTVYVTPLSAILADYDRFHMYWSPATAGNLTIRLEQDASNYLEKTLTYAGTVATGWLAIGDSSTSIATHTYNLAYKYSAITLQFDDSCSVRIRQFVGSIESFVTAWVQVRTQPVTIPLNPALSTTSLVVDVTNLHLLDVVYGIRCISATLLTVQDVVIGSGMGTAITWSGTIHVDPSREGSYNTSFPQPTAEEQINFVVLNTNVVTQSDGLKYAVQDVYVYKTVQTAVTQTQKAVVPVLVPESSPLDQELDIALTDFTKTGNPVTITKVTLTATGNNYYDAPSLKNTRGTRKFVEVFADWYSIGTDKPMIRRSDQWRNSSVAMDFAQALCDKYSVPLVGYTETVDWDAPVDIGDVVSTPDGNYVVYSISWNPAEMTKTIAVGERIKNTITWIENMNQNVSDLQRMV